MTKTYSRLALAATLLFFSACQKSTVVKESLDQSKVGTLEMSGEEFAKSTKYMFLDDEPEAVSFNNALRSFSTTSPLQVTLTDDSLKVRFYSPRPISNVEVYAKVIGYSNPVKIISFAEIPAFADFAISAKNFKEEKLYPTAEGKMVLIPGLKTSETVLSVKCNDAYYKKLQDIKIQWNVSFSAYSRQGNWAYKILPVHMRAAVALTLNLSYFFSTPRYQDSILNNWKGTFIDNDGVSIVNNDALLVNMKRNRNLVMGHTSGVSGLGGGSVYGLTQWQYLEQYADDKSQYVAMFHEFGHVLGYDLNADGVHRSGMTYGRWWQVSSKLYEQLSISKDLPVYSRNFLKSRQNSTLYNYTDAMKNQKSEHVID